MEATTGKASTHQAVSGGAIKPKKSDKGKESQWYHPPKGQPIKYLQCGDCDYKTTTAIRLENHVESFHPRPRLPISCITISGGGLAPVEDPHEESTKSSSKSTASRVTKQPSKPAESSLAGISFRHQFKCRHCGFRTSQEKYLTNHESMHERKAAHQCRLCTYSVDNEGHLIRHMKRDHPAGDQGSQGPSGVIAKVKEEPVDRPKCPAPSGPNHRCTGCDYTSPSTSNLKKHQERHEHPGRFQCPHCTYSAYTEFFIEQHIERDHNGRKTADVDCVFIDLTAEEEEPSTEIVPDSGKRSKRTEDPLQMDEEIQKLPEIDGSEKSESPEASSEPVEDWPLVRRPFRPSGKKSRPKTLPKFSDEEEELPEPKGLQVRPGKELLSTPALLDLPETPPLRSPTLPASSILGPSAIFVLDESPKEPSKSATKRPEAKTTSSGPSVPPSLPNINAELNGKGQEGSKKGRSKGKKHKAPQRSAVISILPDVVELNGYATSDGQSPPPIALDDAVVPVSRKRPREEEAEESEVLHCPDCLYWARTPASFHEHYMTHKGTKAFKCSGCDKTFKLHSDANDHIRNEKADPKHRNAQAVAAQPLPIHNYVAFRRLATVPVGAVDGWNPSRIADAQQEDPDGVSGPTFDKLDDLEAFTASSRPLDTKRKKTMRMGSAEEEDCLKEMDQLESGIQAGFRSLENGKKSTRTESSVLRNRMEVLKGKMEAGEIRVKELQARREELDGKIKEATDRKVKAELNARTRQCESLQLRLQASDPRSPKVSQRALDEADEAFRCAEAKVKRMDSKLRDVQSQKEDLIRQVEEASQSILESSRRLDAIKAELEENSSHSASLHQMKSPTRKQIRSYVDRAECLVQIVHKEALERMGLTEMEWLDAVERSAWQLRLR